MKTPKQWLEGMEHDADVAQWVRAELEYDPSIGHVGRVETKAADGTVTIKGTVYSLAQKWAVEHAVRRVMGVLEVVNELTVDPPKAIFHADQDIADAVSAVLNWTAGVPDGIEVSVVDGCVTLEGTVGEAWERELAESAVRSLVGVRRIENRLRLAIVEAAADICREVEHAIRRRTGGVDVSVEYENGTVTLRGFARSWAVRARADEAARLAPGVKKVVNQLVMEPSMAVTH